MSKSEKTRTIDGNYLHCNVIYRPQTTGATETEQRHGHSSKQIIYLVKEYSFKRNGRNNRKMTVFLVKLSYEKIEGQMYVVKALNNYFAYLLEEIGSQNLKTRVLE